MAASRLSRPGWKLLGALLLGALAWGGARPALGGLDFFRVRRIQVNGFVNYRVEEIARVIPVREGQSIFDDLAAARAAAESLPGLQEVRVSRRLPGTIVVHVRERAPVALTMHRDRLVPVGEEGTILPFDPTATGLDLPLVREPDSVVTRLLARVRDADATFFARINAASASGEDVIISADGRRFLFRADAGSREFEAVATVERELERRARRWTELDARFTGQVVARGGAA